MCGWCCGLPRVRCPRPVLLAVASVGNVGGIHRAPTKGVVTELGEGVRDTDPDPELYAWILVLPIGLMLQQSSLQVGANRLVADDHRGEAGDRFGAEGSPCSMRCCTPAGWPWSRWWQR